MRKGLVFLIFCICYNIHVYAQDSRNLRLQLCLGPFLGIDQTSHNSNNNYFDIFKHGVGINISADQIILNNFSIGIKTGINEGFINRKQMKQKLENRYTPATSEYVSEITCPETGSQIYIGLNVAYWFTWRGYEFNPFVTLSVAAAELEGSIIHTKKLRTHYYEDINLSPSSTSFFLPSVGFRFHKSLNRNIFLLLGIQYSYTSFSWEMSEVRSDFDDQSSQRQVRFQQPISMLQMEFGIQYNFKDIFKPFSRKSKANP